ncbi:type IV pilus secretin PilQ [Methylonatrum kenyense]|uniref:type IV pilus secretin PilQ n=1 Tax=Methylonatrum kenyense TaxID=455253 RepID=UPI0020BFCC8A|nr:type IV pilus secretin PilQ [Methylonatrum kenyense]MCK8516847.1 type IV pilus secretin PilQ [Methylonatrum kenyense]
MNSVTFAPNGAARGQVFRFIFLIGLLLFGLQTAAAETSVSNIEYTTLPGNEVQIAIELDGEPVRPSSFSVDDPARITFDFPGTRNALSERSVDIGVGRVERVNTAEAGGRTRVVLQLSEMMRYDAELDGNRFLITLRDRSDAPAQRDLVQRTDPDDAVRRTARRELMDIDFRRGSDNAGRVVIELSDDSTDVDLRRDGDHIVARFSDTELPERLQRRLNVEDFATPVRTIDTRQDGRDVVMRIRPEGEYRHMGYQADNVFTVEFQPMTRAEQERAQREDPEYTGERLSLNFQDIEVRAVLQLIADFTGLNVVVSDRVTGNLTLRLQNVPWDHALDIILRTQGLDKRITDNVMLVAPAEEIAERERLDAQARRDEEELAPLRSDYFQINYAKAGDISTLLQSADATLLSERGNVTIDERTNTLIIRDTESNLSEIRRLINRLDIPVRQVLIESRIVLANDDFSRELGVRFGASAQRRLSRGDGAVIGGTRPGGIADPGTGFPAETDSPGLLTGTEFREGQLVDLPVNDPAGAVGLAIGRIGDRLLQLELSALESEGRGEIVSSPRVITSNQRTASIKQGVEIPYQEATASGATNVSFQEAVLALDVTPQITPDNRVIMDLEVSKDTIGEVFLGVPSIDTQSVTTQVLVENGETVVLGGIYERDRRQQVSRVPFFGSLPGIGWLFRSNLRIDENSELLIFVTPRILDESLSGGSVQ